jgi:hypothetical protein
MIHISKEIWSNRIQGWNIVDCAVRSKDVISLLMRRDIAQEDISWTADADIESRLINLFINQTENVFGDRTYTGLNLPKLGVCSLPLSQAMMVARNNDGQVVLLGGGRDFPDEFIDIGKVPMPWRIKTIDGYAYSVGGQRKIYKRTSIGQWNRILEVPRVEAIETVGFKDMDAFSESDMYAVGGHGDVWYFDGKQWKQMGFPSNVQLGTVTCAGDGNVYISGEGGSLWVGQKSTWKNIYKGSSSILWNDVLWFEGKLWLSSDYQFRIWNGKSLEPVMHEGKAVPMNGHMDAYDGLLAIASSEYVMTYDGKSWKHIVSPYLD